MGVVLRSFEMPKTVVHDESTATDTYGKFTAEPFERGFGATVGNAMRRVLLSSLEGAAVSAIRIEGVSHEFTTIPGVLEDVAEIILNIKQLTMRAHSRSVKTLTIDVERKGEVTAADIQTDDTVDILSPELPICTLTKKTRLRMEFEVSRGRGYVVAENNKRDDQPVGTIAVDSIYSPVRRVAFKVEDTRVGQITDYDRLSLEIWTNGAVTPKEALLYAANIMQQQVNVFVNLGRLPEEEGESEPGESEDSGFFERLQQPVSEMELSVRSANCLNEARIKTIGDLVTRSESEMLKYRNFGKKSLNEISEILKGMGLRFGMKVDPKKLKQAAENF